MEWKLLVLGSNSAVPTPYRHPSAQTLDVARDLFLIDCGEGTQVRLSEFKVRRSRINHIFITHLHGDHIFGLPGLITSYSLYGRNEPLHLYGPIGLSGFVNGVIKSTQIKLPFDLNIHEHQSQTGELIFDSHYATVWTIPLEHRIATTGYLFTEKVRPRRIDPQAVSQYKVPHFVFDDLQTGLDWYAPDGTLVPNKTLTRPGRSPLKYAYCSDTSYLPTIIPLVAGVNLLYHEATFLNDLRDQANLRGHSTALEAAMIAREAEVKQLLLGHFSSRYLDLNAFVEEAASIFPNTLAAEEGVTYLIK